MYPAKAAAASALFGMALLVYCTEAVATKLETDAGRPIANKTPFPPFDVFEDGTGVVGYVEPVQQTDQLTSNIITFADWSDHRTIDLINASNATQDYDCHGLTFKSKKLWIDDQEVPRILNDQGWKKRGAEGVPDPAQVGDIVIYRNPDAITASHPTDVTHSGIVTAVDATGKVTKVLSKWGARGDYNHAPLDVPKEYLGASGTVEVRTGGKPLVDPPLNGEEINIFDGHTQPPLKPWVGALLWSTDATIYNDYPVTTVIEQTHGPINWNYGLSVPLDGLVITAGDTLDLFGTQWIGGDVSGLASMAAYGGWEFGSVSGDSLKFEATSTAFVPGSFADIVDGFTGISRPSPVGELVYIEDVAGSIGFVSGPTVVPEPSTLLLLATGLVGLVGYGSRRTCRRSSRMCGCAAMR